MTGYTPIDSGRFNVLGYISVEGKKGGASYYEILEAAKAQYGDVDEVVNIHLDQKNTTTTKSSAFNSSSSSKKAIIMTGLAIKYKD